MEHLKYFTFLLKTVFASQVCFRESSAPFSTDLIRDSGASCSLTLDGLSG